MLAEIEIKYFCEAEKMLLTLGCIAVERNKIQINDEGLCSEKEQ